MMSDEKFFSQVRSSMESFAPDAPAEVYSGMRKKLWWNNFTKLSVTRFNIWYILLFVGIGGGALAYNNTCDAPANSGIIQPLKPEVAPVANQPIAEPKEEKALEISTPTAVEVKTEVAVEPTVSETAVAKKKTATTNTEKKKKKTSTIVTPEVVSAPIVVPAAETVSAPVESSSSDADKEEAPKKKRKKLTLDIYTPDPSKNAGQGEN